ncbi:MAG: Panacea domain-containing protein [Candidatus Korarchaeota archaeon]|nr:Panacea domain-containing protein [Candidatus Korarchaeota archaeon]
MGRNREYVAYVMSRLGCVHPFRISRILLLADWLSMERRNKRLTNLTYVKEEFGFYVEELTGIMEELQDEGCVIKREERKCLEYTCSEPEISEEDREILEEVISEVRDLDDRELNRRVLSDPRYREGSP